MRKQFEFSEEDLYLAAREAEQFIRAQYPDAQTCPPHTFSPAFEADMQQLFVQLQTGTLKPSAARLGWPYYLRRSIAAILLCFLLACVTMPEAVMAGYQKLIEVVEHVFEECTRVYYSTDSFDTVKFKPLNIGYLPDGFREVRKIEKENSIDLLYKNFSGRYFKIYQCLEKNESSAVYGMDTEDAVIEIISIRDMEIKLVSKNQKTYFVCKKYDNYISGQTNLSREEIIMIFNNVSL